jgi:hypothetical protein
MLDALKDDEAMQLRNEARTQSSIDLISNLPLTLDNLIKEEEDRREKLRATKVREDVTERQTKISESASKRAERESNERRITEAMENVVAGTAAYEGTPPQQQNVPAQVQPEAAKPPVAMPEPNLANAAVPQQPILGGQEPALSPTIPISATEAKKEYALNPVIQARFEKAKAVFQNEPRFASFKDEELLGLIVLDERKRQAAQEAAQYKQDSLDLRAKDIDSKIKERDAKISKLKQRVPKGVKPDIRGLTQGQIKVMTEARMDFERNSDVIADIVEGRYEPGLVNGLEERIRNYLRFRSTDQAGAAAKLALTTNKYVNDNFGATVTTHEFENALKAIATTYDDPDVLIMFLENLKEEAAKKHDYTLEYAEKGRRSGTPLTDRGIDLLGKGKDKPSNPKKNEPEKSVDQRIDEKLNKLFGE